MKGDAAGPTESASGDAPGDPRQTGPVGPFPSWGALYATVVIYALAVVVLLYLFTVFLNVPAAAP